MRKKNKSYKQYNGNTTEDSDLPVCTCQSKQKDCTMIRWNKKYKNNSKDTATNKNTTKKSDMVSWKGTRDRA